MTIAGIGMKTYTLVGLMVLMCSGVIAAPRANITIRVVDEAGIPIQGANAAIYFEMYRDNIKSFKGLTDTNGLFSAQDETDTNVSEVAEKEGYYKSSETHFFRALNKDQTRYEPWDDVRTLTLRKIIDPKEGKKAGTRGTVPKLDEPLGFDILAGDWVNPYGQGVVSDFVFTCSNNTEENIASYTLTFPNEGDGVIEYPRDKKGQSIFRWPYKAPLDGYLSVLKNKEIYAFDKNTTIMSDYKTLPQEPSDIIYVFRIRTKYNADGNIVSAFYGKIFGAIEINWNNRLRFGYWLNTDPTSRSLESTDPYSP
jgi:hypothetical protein